MLQLRKSTMTSPKQNGETRAPTSSQPIGQSSLLYKPTLGCAIRPLEYQATSLYSRSDSYLNSVMESRDISLSLSTSPKNLNQSLSGAGKVTYNGISSQTWEPYFPTAAFAFYWHFLHHIARYSPSFTWIRTQPPIKLPRPERPRQQSSASGIATQ